MGAPAIMPNDDEYAEYEEMLARMSKAASERQQAARKRRRERAALEQASLRRSAGFMACWLQRASSSSPSPKRPRNESSSQSPPSSSNAASRADAPTPTPALSPATGAAAAERSMRLSPPSSEAEVQQQYIEYHPLRHAWWSVGEPTPYLHLARTFSLVESTTKRLRTTALLGDMFRAIVQRSPADLAPACYLTTNRLAPPYEGVELNVGGASVAAAISQATGASAAAIKRRYNELGDLGDVAQTCRVTTMRIVRPKALTVSGVYAKLRAVACMRGAGVVKRRRSALRDIIVAARECECRYVVRTMVQHLRIGAAVTTVLSALGRAFAMESHATRDGGDDDSSNENARAIERDVAEAVARITEAYAQCPSFERICRALCASGDGWRRLRDECALTPGIPLKPMLGTIARSAEQVFQRLGAGLLAEYKYDGMRAQIHLFPPADDGSGGSGNSADDEHARTAVVKIFSRHLEDVTLRYVDVQHAVRQAAMAGDATTTDVILDAEIVAVGDNDDATDGGGIRSFQSLTTRQRKGVVDAQSITVSACVFAFDLLYLDGEALLKQPLRARREALHRRFAPTANRFVFAASRVCDSVDEVAATLNDACAAKCEGLMCKALDNDGDQQQRQQQQLATYDPAVRANNWSKLKRDYMDGLADSVDVVPIAAWWGNGRKAGWFSPFLLAVHRDDGVLQSLCKVMSGFSDAMYRCLTAFYGQEQSERILPRRPPHYDCDEDALRPDVWLDACQVWEVRGAELTLSPVHRAGSGGVDAARGRGCSMRFPRFIRVREDKQVEDATTDLDICDMFRAQQQQQQREEETLDKYEEEEEERAEECSQPEPAATGVVTPSIADLKDEDDDEDDDEDEVDDDDDQRDREDA